MSGGVVQLVATGAQDAWLTGKPEVSFFRTNYKRYTHYASSVERQIIQGTPIAGGMSTIRIEKKGDLLNYMYLTARDSTGAMVYNFDWSKVIDKVELLIGGQVIDTQDFEYMSDIEPVTGGQTYSTRYLNSAPSGPTNQKSAFFPLKFFFCKDWSVSLPMVALQFHDVDIRITWSVNLNSTLTFGPTNVPLLGVPQATASITSSGTAAVLGGNTANIQVSQFSGPVFSGSLFVAPGSNLQTNTSVIHGFYNALSDGVANAVVNFSNSAQSNITGSGAPYNTSGAVANIYAPQVTAQIPTTTTITGSSAALSFNTFSSPTSGSSVSVGQYVAGLPVTGPVYVSNTSNLASGNVTVSYPSTASTVGVPAGTTVSFFNGSSVSASTYAGIQFQAWADFVYLDQTERDYFAKTTQDLLITQVTRVNILTNSTQEIALAQPIKFLAFPAVNYSQIYANGSNPSNALNYILKTQINGIDIGEFKFIPQWVDIPQYYNTPFGYVHNNAAPNVAILSYCLDTSKLQPTGTLNFSRLDTFRLVTSPQVPNGILGLCNPNINYPVSYLYAVNYNVLRIQNGLGGVLYAN